MIDDTITCPNCGESNPVDLPYCRNCQWRLRPGEDDGGRTDDDAGSTYSESGRPSGEVPDWLKGKASPPRQAAPGDEALAQQLRDRLDPRDADGVLPNAPQRALAEDLLAGLGETQESDDEEVPDWVARIMGLSDSHETASTDSLSPFSPSGGDAVGYSGSPGSDPQAAGALDYGAEHEREAAGASTDSLADADRQAPENTKAPAAAEDGDIFEWLRKMDAGGAIPPVDAERKDIPATTDVPTWVGRMLSVTGDPVPEQSGESGALPDWLSTMQGPADAPASAPLPAPPEAFPHPLPPKEPAPPPLESPPPRPVTPPIAKEPEPPPLPALLATNVDAESSPDAPEALDVDAVFASMQLPSWATDTGDRDSAASGEPPAAHSDEPISAVDLPSWVQALRPVESAAAPVESKPQLQSRESTGPLLGLEGVLPAAPGSAVPTSTPKPHAMKLEVSERHRAQAHLLEGLLDVESRPLPLPSSKTASSSRLFRWAVSAALLAAVVISLGSGAKTFALPAFVAPETNGAIHALQSVPPDAPVLAVFDYEPATAGEMEAAASAILDELLLLKHPRLALLSTSPTGWALAERFVTTTLRERAYVRDVHYVNLGYLPGGLSGVQFFALDPTIAIPFDAGTRLAWNSGVLLGATKLSDFAATVVLTDGLESGRIWIEQTTDKRGGSPMVIISSAQAGPMLVPYYDSGQIQGLVAGMQGAAGAETANGGRPGYVRAYWDAYNLGIYLAAAVIIAGALWQLLGRVLRRSLEAA